MPSDRIIEIAGRIRQIMEGHVGPSRPIKGGQIVDELYLRWPHLGNVNKGELARAVVYLRIVEGIPIIPCENHLRGMFWANQQSQIDDYYRRRRGPLLGELKQLRIIRRIEVKQPPLQMRLL